jgi:uncharacterized protein (DUF305 family)
MKYFFLKIKLFSVLLIFVSGVSGVSGQQGLKLMEPMEETLSELEEFEMSGDADNDFASMIITHYKGGIKMIDEIIEKGSDPATRNLALSFRDNHQKYINELEKYVSDDPQKQSNEEFVKEVQTDLKKAREIVDNNLPSSGNPDEDFAFFMSKHFENGINLTRTGIKYTKNQGLRQIAEEMLKDQQNEKKEIEGLLNK